MRAGSLNTRVTIQQRDGTQDEYEQPLPEGWVNIVTVWADVRHQGGLESMKADSPTSVVKASIRIRYRTGINAGMRVLVGGVAYDIQAVLPDLQTRNHLDLVCQAVA